MPRQTKQMGESWWARQWLGVLAAFGGEYASRLSRGRSYAMNGRVWQAEVHPGLVSARVQGSFIKPYEVEIRVAPLADATWDRVIAVLAGQATYAAKLLAGEMPTDIETVFAQAGAHLFPHDPEDVDATCTCLDWSRPCKHIIAVHYLLADNLDLQPALLFTLRGRTIEQVVEALRARWAAEVHEVRGAATTTAGAADGAAEAAPATSAPLRAGSFYRAGAELDEFRLTITAPQVDGALLKRLGKPPFAAESEDPLPALLRAYAAVTTRALQAQARGGSETKAARRKAKN